jgi:hypothetical protein
METGILTATNAHPSTASPYDEFQELIRKYKTVGKDHLPRMPVNACYVFLYIQLPLVSSWV